MSVNEARHAEQTLFLMSLGALGLLVLLFAMLTRHLTRPLTEITAAVERVARGEWRVDVPSAGRQDEIGMIARAVASMQVALIERDRMRQEIIRIDAINQRRLLLGKAVNRFEDGMSIVIENISGTVRTLTEASEALNLTARETEQQAERIRTSSTDTATKASLVSGATLQLSEGIREIGKRANSTRSVVFESEDGLRRAGEDVGSLGHVAREAEDALATVQSLVADLGHIALSSLLSTARQGDSHGDTARAASAVQDLAERTAEAAARIGVELARINAVADGTVVSLEGITTGLGSAIRDASEISVVVAEQNAAARQIAEGLDAAAASMGGLTEAVGQLRTSISGAHDATTDFVRTARRIIEDARAIDESVRSFVREVAA